MIIRELPDDRFYMTKSSITLAGNGLFANKRLSKGDYLEIIGIKVEVGQLADECTSYSNPYKFLSKFDNTLIVPMGYAGIVNHASENHNCEIRDMNFQKQWINSSNAATGLIYHFSRDIEKDEEILGNYGYLWDSKFRKEKTEEEEWATFSEKALYNFVKITKMLG